jgi:hypothetical protein
MDGAWVTRGTSLVVPARDLRRALLDCGLVLALRPCAARSVLLESLLDGVASQFNSVVQLQLAERALDVVLHGPVRYDEPFRDLLIRQAFGDHAQYLGLPPGEAGRAVGRGGYGGQPAVLA